MMVFIAPKRNANSFYFSLKYDNVEREREREFRFPYAASVSYLNSK